MNICAILAETADRTGISSIFSEKFRQKIRENHPITMLTR